MKSIIIRVDQQLFDALKENKERTGVPVATFLRRAARLALFADRKKAEPRSAA